VKEFWKRRILDPLKGQLTQGVTPHLLGLSCALGVTLGIFPLLGTTTLLCLLAGIALKLNQPSIQAVNYLIYPVQIAMVPVFVRMGETLFHATPVPLTPTTLIKEFAQGPGPFLAKYGMAGVYGVSAWALVAPFLIAGLYFPLSRTFQKMKERL
jgi:uncharacterized protein (DUF2062 family)